MEGDVATQLNRADAEGASRNEDGAATVGVAGVDCGLHRDRVQRDAVTLCAERRDVVDSCAEGWGVWHGASVSTRRCSLCERRWTGKDGCRGDGSHGRYGDVLEPLPASEAGYFWGDIRRGHNDEGTSVEGDTRSLHEHCVIANS